MNPRKRKKIVAVVQAEALEKAKKDAEAEKARLEAEAEKARLEAEAAAAALVTKKKKTAAKEEVKTEE